MGYKISKCTVGGAVVLLLLLQAIPSFSAMSGGSFLYVEENGPLPHFRLQEFVSKNMKVFDGGGKRPLVLAFLGTDNDTKRERAIEVLRAMQDALAFYRARNIELAAVFVQPEQISHINEVINQGHIDFPVYVDSENQSFEKLGVYVMPSLLIVNADGIIHKGLGYTHNLDEILPGEIKVMLHEKTREEMSAELYPVSVVRTMAQRQARLDYNYAVNLVKRQKIDLALEKLEMALDKDPQFVPALVEKGCLLVKKKKFKEAEELLERSIKLMPESERALACRGELNAAKNKEDQGAGVPGKSDPASWGIFADDDDDEGEQPN